MWNRSLCLAGLGGVGVRDRTIQVDSVEAEEGDVIVLYEVMFGPQGECGLYGQTSVEWVVDRWHGSKRRAQAAAHRLCRSVGPRPQPGIQNTKPIPVIVVRTRFSSIAAVANRKPISRKEVYRIFSTADGGWVHSIEPREMKVSDL